MNLLFAVSVAALFLASVFQELLSAYYLRCVNEERPWAATIVAFVHSLVGWALWLWFLNQMQAEATGFQAIVCSVGGAIGTFFGLRKPGNKKGVT